MSLTPLLDVLVTDPIVRDILMSQTAPAGAGAPKILDIAVSAGARPPLIAALAGADELGGLTRSFADMTQQLADARSAVQQSMSRSTRRATTCKPSWTTSRQA